MSKLIIRASFGPIENRQPKEAPVDNQISQKVLSVFLRCYPEDLEKVSTNYHVPQVIIPRGEDKVPAVFYKIDV